MLGGMSGQTAPPLLLVHGLQAEKYYILRPEDPASQHGYPASE